MSKYQPGPKIFTLSVMHTGTSFTNILIGKHLIGHVHFHMPFSFEDNKQLDRADLLLIPLRHPRAVWNSWWLRGQKEQEYRLGWHMMQDFVNHHEVLFLPVDLVELRDVKLMELSRKLDVPLFTDWEPKGQYQGERRPMPRAEEIDLTTIMELPVVRRFYQ